MMKIGNLNTDEKVMIIAEVGINHNGDFATACELLRQAHGDNAD